MGGVIIGHEMGRALGSRRCSSSGREGVFELRRGFRLEPGAKVLMVEDVVTTGLSSREAIEAIARGRRRGDRRSRRWSTARAARPISAFPSIPLIRIDVPTYAADALPPELAAIPAIKPGSRAAA